MSSRRFVILIVFLGVLGLAIWWQLRPHRAIDHEEAMERWASLANNALKKRGVRGAIQGESATEAYRVFKACFRAGDEASKYETLLAGAHNRTEDGRVVYYWWRQAHETAGEGDICFEVHVTDSGSPVIERVEAHEMVN